MWTKFTAEKLKGKQEICTIIASKFSTYKNIASCLHVWGLCCLRSFTLRAKMVSPANIKDIPLNWKLKLIFGLSGHSKQNLPGNNRKIFVVAKLL